MALPQKRCPLRSWSIGRSTQQGSVRPASSSRGRRTDVARETPPGEEGGLMVQVPVLIGGLDQRGWLGLQCMDMFGWFW